jgi:WXXGXW repeat (2 copies)
VHSGLTRAQTALRQQPANASSGSQTERAVLDIDDAQRAVAVNDPAGALRAIDDAFAAVTASGPVASAAGEAAPPPMVTYAWMAGRWAPNGSGFVWVPPDTVGRLAVERTWVPEGWVWRGGQYVWVPAHWEN